MKWVLCIVFLFQGLNNSLVVAQNSVGATAGALRSTFFDLKKHNIYPISYQSGYGGCTAVFFETPVDTVNFARIELQVSNGSAGLVTKNGGHEAFYSDVNFKWTQLALNTMLNLEIGKTKKLDFSFMLGVGLGYNLINSSKGEGYQVFVKTTVDSSGNTIHYFDQKDWKVNNQHSKNFGPVNFHFLLGPEIRYRMSDKWELLFQNEYWLTVTGKSNLPNVDNNAIFSGVITLGARYSLRKNK